ncbi:MAG TPA: hypothetical protein VD838_02960 [Anaeromyxobacteraceae bacterium]|nr:hypothetical protein [Anaeromyxobacteraceae bacterium]
MTEIPPNEPTLRLLADMAQTALTSIKFGAAFWVLLELHSLVGHLGDIAWELRKANVEITRLVDK